jgi:hypothetical protein
VADGEPKVAIVKLQPVSAHDAVWHNSGQSRAAPIPAASRHSLCLEAELPFPEPAIRYGKAADRLSFTTLGYQNTIAAKQHPRL